MSEAAEMNRFLSSKALQLGRRLTALVVLQMGCLARPPHSPPHILRQLFLFVGSHLLRGVVWLLRAATIQAKRSNILPVTSTECAQLGNSRRLTSQRARTHSRLSKKPRARAERLRKLGLKICESAKDSRDAGDTAQL